MGKGSRDSQLKLQEVLQRQRVPKKNEFVSCQLAEAAQLYHDNPDEDPNKDVPPEEEEKWLEEFIKQLPLPQSTPLKFSYSDLPADPTIGYQDLKNLAKVLLKAKYPRTEAPELALNLMKS